jgi:hypothetical protein
MITRWIVLSVLIAAPVGAQSPDTVWTRTFDIPESEDDAVGFATDGAGNGYLLVFTRDTGYVARYVVVKYAPDGETLWTRFGPTAPMTNDEGGIACDPAGNVAVAYAWNDDFLVAKCTPAGDTIWTRRFDSGETDYPYDVACDRSGNVIVTGRSHNGNDWDYLTVKYSPQGDTIWTRRFDSGGFDDWAYSVALDAANGVVVGGKGQLGQCGFVKYDSLGGLIWNSNWPGGQICDVAVEPGGNVIVAGMSNYEQYMLTRCDPLGNGLWTVVLDSAPSAATSVCPDGKGGILVTGYYADDAHTMRFDTTGGISWQVTWDDSEEVSNAALCLDAQGDLLVAATLGWWSTANFVTVIKYGLAGAISEGAGQNLARPVPGPTLLGRLPPGQVFDPQGRRVPAARARAGIYFATDGRGACRKVVIATR